MDFLHDCAGHWSCEVCSKAKDATTKKTKAPAKGKREVGRRKSKAKSAKRPRQDDADADAAAGGDGSGNDTTDEHNSLCQKCGEPGVCCVWPVPCDLVDDVTVVD